MPQQLPLPFSFNPELGFEQFHPGANAEPVGHLKRTAVGEGEHFIFLWGETGAGKTHLLNACCQAASERRRSVSFLPLEIFLDYGPETLDGLEYQDLICLDDVDAVIGREDWEIGLFNLFNRLREAHRDLIVTAKAPPAHTPIRLPDLQTRFGWGLTLRLYPLADKDKLTVLDLHARSLGLELPPQVGRYLLARYRRDLPALRDLLNQLDHATLAAKRRLTIPFVKTFLEETA